MDEDLTKQETEAREKSLRKRSTMPMKETALPHETTSPDCRKAADKRYLTADGKVIHLSEEQRQQRINEAKDQIDEFCKP